MNPLPPIRPAHQPIQREPSEYNCEEVQEIIYRFKIYTQLEILYEYLERNDPKMLLKVLKMMQRHGYRSYREMRKLYRATTLDVNHMPSRDTRRLVRKMIGEAHWRLYLEYYKQYSYYGDGTKIQLGDSDFVVPLPPPFPTLSLKLDEHVTSYIFSFLGGKDMYEASKVSREFRDALVPRQKNVTMAGFSSFESFRQMNFIGMEYFETGRENSIVTGDILLLMANDIESYPNLSRAFLETYTSSGGELGFERELGPRLEKMRSCIFLIE
jgi:hypothetical protein